LGQVLLWGGGAKFYLEKLHDKDSTGEGGGVGAKTSSKRLEPLLINLLHYPRIYILVERLLDFPGVARARAFS